MSYCKSINILNIISNYYLVCRASSAPVAVSGCSLLSPSSTVPATPVCIIYTISYTYVWYILYYITYHHISYVFNYNTCYMLPCLSHLIWSCCSIRLLSVVLFFNCSCYSCLHYIHYIIHICVIVIYIYSIIICVIVIYHMIMLPYVPHILIPTTQPIHNNWH